MGHPGGTAFHDLVKAAVDQGIIVTVGNSPMTDLQKDFGTKGMGYAGVDLYAGGTLTAAAMLAKGLKSGDEAMVYGVFSQAERGQSEKGPRRYAREGAGSRSTAWRSPRRSTATSRSACPCSSPTFRAIPS